jgi:hypothetical protein
MAIHLMTSSKKEISTHQVARELGITQKSAWLMDHRVREAMKRADGEWQAANVWLDCKCRGAGAAHVDNNS